MAIGKYVPIIKTTDAEIKGYKYLDNEVKVDTLPLFELTRSRPVKNFPDGDIYRRMEQVGEYAGSNQFILDLTSHEDLCNRQIEALMDDADGFAEWRIFLSEFSSLNIIPTLHLYPDELGTFRDFIRLSEERYPIFAFRCTPDVSAENFRVYMGEAAKVLDLSKRLYLVVDADFVDLASFNAKLDWAAEILVVAGDLGIENVSINSSSFPSSVAKYGDSAGEIPMLELNTYRQLQDDRRFSNNSFGYGDYAGIHPIRNNVRGGSWVPRVDLSLDSSYVYRRYRRDDGGYIRAARALVNSDDFQPVGCWGADQIRLAAEGNPGGKSPSHWISVRLNQHVSRFSQLYSDLLLP